MADGHDGNNRNMVILKTSLRSILRNHQHLMIYQDVVTRINKLVTAAYLFICYIFVNAYDDDGEFNADQYVTPGFFTEVLKLLQPPDRTGRATSDHTRRFRAHH